MDIQGLLLAIESDIVTFQFSKVNNSSRIAMGTRSLELIPEKHHPKGTGKSKGEGILTFFDWQKQEWRSCKMGKIFGEWKVTKEHMLVRQIAETAKLF